MVHDRTVEGEELKLEASGQVRLGNLVMYDKNSATLWLQETGKALEGEKAGKALAECKKDEEWFRDVRWDDWRAKHPETLVLRCRHCEGEE